MQKVMIRFTAKSYYPFYSQKMQIRIGQHIMRFKLRVEKLYLDIIRILDQVL